MRDNIYDVLLYCNQPHDNGKFTVKIKSLTGLPSRDCL